MNQYPVEPYHIVQRPSTSGNTALLMAASLSLTFALTTPAIVFPAIAPTVRPSTVGQFGNMFASAYHSQSVDFEGAVTNFYSTLLAKQQPLGKEFERVLHDNLWDLYVRS
jgi:hypothetical protein